MSKPISPFVVGITGTELTHDTIGAFQALNPAGVILMGHNCQSAGQVKELCTGIKETLTLEDPPIFIDQEGGRVRRIDWFDIVNIPAGRIGSLYKRSPQFGLELATLNALVIGAKLHELGISANCAPVADLRIDGASDVIGDRAFSDDPTEVALLCGAALSGFASAGIWPTIKHAPGHGRAMADSHHKLPTVAITKDKLMNEDCRPFLANQKCPFVMTAHIAYPALGDAQPLTQSSKGLQFLKNELGMEGMIISDDLGMEALDGSLLERAQKTLMAGVDLALYCGVSVKGEPVPNLNEQLAWLADKFEVSAEVQQKLENLPPRVKITDDETKNAKERIAYILKNVL